MKKRHVYRVDDLVEVIKPKFIKRVGYPIVWTDLMDSVRRDSRTYQAYVMLFGSAPGIDETKGFDYPHEFLRFIAHERAKEVAYGGDVRSIHYYGPNEIPPGQLQITTDPPPEPGPTPPMIARVRGKRVVKTGIRFAPTYGRSHGFYDDEDWSEPGGLDNCKTHVLLKTDLGEIEACNVKPHRDYILLKDL